MASSEGRWCNFDSFSLKFNFLYSLHFPIFYKDACSICACRVWDIMVNFSEDISPLLLIWFVDVTMIFFRTTNKTYTILFRAIFGSTGCVQLFSYYYDMNLWENMYDSFFINKETCYVILLEVCGKQRENILDTQETLSRFNLISFVKSEILF